MRDLLSERLLTIAKQVNEQDVVADIGTDHSLVPIYLALSHKAKLVYACDIAQGPLLMAKENLKKYKVDENDVSLILTDGLEWIVDNKKHIDSCIIAGMGGGSIVEILKRDDDNIERYILSPNCEIEIVRNWVKLKKYFLEQEIIMKDHDKIYEILVINKTYGVRIKNQYDIIFGPILRKTQSDVFDEKWNLQCDRWMTILSQIDSKSDRYRKLKVDVAMIGKVIKKREKAKKKKGELWN